MKKLLPLLVVGIFVLGAFGASAAQFYNINSNARWSQKEISGILSGEELDQYQLEMDWFGPVGNFYLTNEHFILAQAFTPTKSILAKVELMAGRNSTTTHDYVVSIRDDLNGADLTSVNVAADQFVIENFSWVEFDFDDITVTPGSTYYIVSSTQDEPDNWYAWGMKVGDVYPNGTVFFTTDYGQTWEEETEGDMTFKTYGRDNSAPETPIITGKINGKVGETYTYCIDTVVDPDGDSLYVYWDWGDGTNSGWLGPYANGEQVCADHSWSEEGTYTVKAKLKDEYGAESDWGYLEVTMPVNYPSSQNGFNILLSKFLQRFSQSFPLVKTLLRV